MIVPSPLLQLVATLALLASTASALPLPSDTLSSRAGPISPDGSRLVLGRATSQRAKRHPRALSPRALEGQEDDDAMALRQRAWVQRNQKRVDASKAMLERVNQHRRHVRRAGLDAPAPEPSVLASAAVANSDAAASTTSSAVPTAVFSMNKAHPAAMKWNKGKSKVVATSGHLANATRVESAGPTPLVSNWIAPIALPTLTVTEVLTLVPIDGHFVDQAGLASGYHSVASGALSRAPASLPTGFSRSAIPTALNTVATASASSAVPTASPSLQGLSHLPLAGALDDTA